MTLLLSASSLFAQERKPGALEAVPIQKDEPAPFSGQLLTPQLAGELAAGVQVCLEKKAVELAHADRKCHLRVATETGACQIDVRALEAKIRVTEAALKEARKQRDTPFWEEPMLVGSAAFVVGVLVATVAIYGSVWAVGELRPVIRPVE